MFFLLRISILYLFSHSINSANFNIHSQVIRIISRFYCNSIKERFNFIDNKLNQLALDPLLIKNLATDFKFILKDNSPILSSEIARCDNVSYAIMRSNFFNHSYFKQFDLERLENELQDSEESTFLLKIHGSPFTDKNGNTSIFPGHSFNIIKIIEKEKIGFRIAHSYIEKYTLAEFLKRQDKYFHNFSSLKKEILIPMYSLLYKKGPWTHKECEDYYSITSIYPHHLLGFFPNIKNIYSESLLPNTIFGRSTNSANNSSYFLVQFSNGKLINPNNAYLAILKQNKISDNIEMDEELKKIFNSIYKKITKLANDHLSIEAFTKMHRSFIRKNLSSHFNKINDENISYAIVQINIFNQSYFKKIKLKDLKEELKNSEQGTFLLEISKDLFIQESFIIIKIIKQEMTVYILFNSYEEKYFTNFNRLEKEVLTSIYLLKEIDIDIGRSSEIKNEQTFSLIKCSNSQIIMPQ